MKKMLVAALVSLFAAPVALAGTPATNQAGSITIDVSATDPNGDPLLLGASLSATSYALSASRGLVGALPALVLLPLARSFDVVKIHSACLASMAAGFAGVYFFAQSSAVLYLLMALMGIGWAAIVSLPFSIMSQRVEPSRIGLYMGVFNLSIVLPQLVVSLGVGAFVALLYAIPTEDDADFAQNRQRFLAETAVAAVVLKPSG